MATFSPIVDVNITINAAGSTREGFGNPLFITGHDAWEERVRSYNDLTELAKDFPQGTPAYSAATNLWAQQPQVPTLYIGRRNMQYMVATPVAPVTGTQYNLSVIVNGGIQQAVTYTSVANDTGLIVLNQLKTQLLAAQTISGRITIAVTGSESAATMTISAKDPATDFVRVSSSTAPTKFSVIGSAYGTAGDVSSYIDEEFTDYYFVGTDDRTKQFVTDLATVIQTKHKIFFTATADPESLSGTSIESKQDLLAVLANTKMTRTAALWHQTAMSNFVEFAYIGYGAPYDAGSETWGNAILSGVDMSRHPTTGRPLTSAQKTALMARNANYVDREGGNNVTRMGLTSGGEWIDIIRGIDWLDQEVTVALRDLLLNQKGGKVTYDDEGINRIKEVISSALQRGVNRNLLSSFTVTVPKAVNCSQQDKRERTLREVSFTGILSGAILTVRVNGSVSY